MVALGFKCQRFQKYGFVTAELIVAMGILVLAMLPVSYGFLQERRLSRAYYFRAIAMEVVDGEMEVLLAGEWRQFSEGPQTYAVRAEAARNLPLGKFVLTRRGERIRLEWLPQKPNQGGRVTREADMK